MTRLSTTSAEMFGCQRGSVVHPQRLWRDWFRPTAPVKPSPTVFFRAASPRGDFNFEDRATGPTFGTVLTVSEAAERLRISRWALYQLIHRRELRTFKVGKRRLISNAAISELISRLQEEAR